MKKFKYFGEEYSVEDRYNYIAVDKNLTVWIYVGKPDKDKALWGSLGGKQHIRYIDNNIAIDWEESLRKIDDLVELSK